jgi:hypothetical protein
VVNAETGATIPATIAIRASDGTIVIDHPSFQEGLACDERSQLCS